VTDFVSEFGRPLIAHRLRRLSDSFVDAYADWLPLAGIEAPARSMSTIILLRDEGPLGVTELAARLRLSHPLMIKLVATLEKLGIVEAVPDPGDARRRPVALTATGQAEADRVAAALGAMDRAYARLFADAGIDLLRAVEGIEAALREESFGERLRSIAAADPVEEEMTCA